MSAESPVSGGEIAASSPPPSAVSVANIVYGLHTFAIVVGIAGTATILGSFIGSVPSIAAVVLNYVKRGDAKGTWLYSHYQWQIRTFWYALLWMLVAGAMILSVIGIFFGFALLAGLPLWLIYRIARGWMRLRDSQPMYV